MILNSNLILLLILMLNRRKRSLYFFEAHNILSSVFKYITQLYVLIILISIKNDRPMSVSSKNLYNVIQH